MKTRFCLPRLMAFVVLLGSRMAFAAPLLDVDDGSEAALVDAPAVASKLPPDRIKAVPRKRLLKGGRLEVFPSVGVTLNDSFYQSIAASISLAFYPQDSFAFGLADDYRWARLETPNVELMRRARLALPADYDPAVLLVHLDAYWFPIYGKASLFDSTIAYLDVFLTSGLGAVSFDLENFDPALNLGLGQHVVIADWLTFRWEIRHHVYVAQHQLYGQPRSSIRNLLMLTMGLGFFVPPSFEYRSL